MRVAPASRLAGEPVLPGDKSISHRYAILGGTAKGETVIENYCPSLDCRSTLNCLKGLGVDLAIEGSRCRIEGRGIQALKAPDAPLDAGNSGTTMRLLSGILAALPYTTVVGGDASLNRRPMQRIIQPLRQMGAQISAREDNFPPLAITGGRLHGIDYTLPVASAQVKSCVLLAGLNAEGRTTVREVMPSRDHTERALPVFGASLRREGLITTVSGRQSLRGCHVSVPGDFSAASFLIAATLLIPGSQLRFSQLGLNPTRTGLLQWLNLSESALRIDDPRENSGEPVGDVTVRYDPGLLQRLPGHLGGEWIPNVIDEIPVLAILGTRHPRGFRVKEAGELRKKESDRIRAVTENLMNLGLEVEEHPDGFFIPPGQTLAGGRVRTYGDHRIAMAFAIAGLISREGVELDNPECCQVSFPGFFEVLESLRQ